MSAPQCRGCQARIRWIKTTAGKSMPCDPDWLSEWVVEAATDTATRRVSLVSDDGKVATGWQASVTTPGSRQIEGYVPHWSTCPKAKEFAK